MSRFPDLPPVWFVGHLVASYVLGLIPFGDISGEGSILMGRAIIVLGIMLIGWSAWWFWRKKTTIEPGHTPTTLIVEGPYRINRNPIYTGMLLVLVGFAITEGTVLALLPCITFPMIITSRFVEGEEDALREAFGEEAESYIARTRRW